MAGEQFEKGAVAAGFDDGVQFFRLARMLALAGCQEIDLPASGWSGADALASSCVSFSNTPPAWQQFRILIWRINPKGFTIVRLPSGVKLKQGHKAPMLVGTVAAASVLLSE